MIGDLIYGDHHQHTHRPLTLTDPTGTYITTKVTEILDAIDNGQRERAGSITDQVVDDGYPDLSLDLYAQLIEGGQRHLTGRYAEVTS